MFLIKSTSLNTNQKRKNEKNVSLNFKVIDQYDSHSFFTLETQIPKIQTKINLHVNWSVELSKRYANK